jgi:hypothetical protein
MAMHECDNQQERGDHDHGNDDDPVPVRFVVHRLLPAVVHVDFFCVQVTNSASMGHTPSGPHLPAKNSATPLAATPND